MLSLAPKLDEIQLVHAKHPPDIAAFTETWLQKRIDDNAICMKNIFVYP